MILANVAQPAKIYELVLLNNIFIQLFWSSFGSLRFFLVEGYLLPLIFKQIRKWNIFNFVSQFGSMFGILSNIQDRGFWTNSGWHLVCDYFQKKLHLRCLAKFWVCLKSLLWLSNVWQDLHLRFLAVLWIWL